MCVLLPYLHASGVVIMRVVTVVRGAGLETRRFALHGLRCMRRAACCMLPVACCLQIVHGMLCAACSLVRVVLQPWRPVALRDCEGNLIVSFVEARLLRTEHCAHVGTVAGDRQLSASLCVGVCSKIRKLCRRSPITRKGTPKARRLRCASRRSSSTDRSALRSARAA